MNSATVVKLLMYQHLQSLGVKKHGQQNDVLLFGRQQMSGLFKKYFVLLAFKRTLSIKFAFCICSLCCSDNACRSLKRI